MDEQELYLCPNCFSQANPTDTYCSQCNYLLSKRSKETNALPPMTVLTQRYIIGRVLGAGGFGITYIAKDLLTDEICAVKEYFPRDWVYRKGTEIFPYSTQKESIFEHGKKRFLEEAKILNRFRDHDNIVKIQNFFASNNTAYLVMEYLNGATFRTLINKKNGKVSFNVAQEVFFATAHALASVHSENVFHRDISAENIFITRDANIKLIDFGSAKQIESDSDRSLSIMLKAGNAPIEQYSSRGKQGPWTDIYSLASTFYQAVTGTGIPPAPDRLENDTLVPLNKMCDNIPHGWSEVIEKALKVNYNDRYQCIEDMLEDLKAVTKESDFKFDTHQPPSPPPPTPAPPPPPPMKKAYIKIEKSQQGIRGQDRIYLEEYRKYTLGRSMHQCDIVVDMAGCVSRQHCIVAYIPQDNCFFVKDISVNGTYLSNGNKLVYERFEKVEPNSIIYLGTSNTAIRVAIE